VHEELVGDIGTSQSKHNLSRICGEGGQDRARAGKPIGDEGMSQSGQQGKDSKRERERENEGIGYPSRLCYLGVVPSQWPP
jgi:hypothetical protein